MNNFQHIQSKLKDFIKKFYLNELIKGSILFLSLGVLYFLFTVFVESFLWLKPVLRTLLFWVFILVELLLLSKFILFPIFKLFGLQKGISEKEASKLIGKHFSQVDDKLLNVLQLKENANSSELLLASIEQKSAEIQPIPFSKAINFKTNTKYLKFAFIPLFIIVVIYISNLKHSFTESYNRVLDHKTAYAPPAPFHFIVKNKQLQVIQGKSITIEVETQGNVVPSGVEIHFSDQQFFFQNSGLGQFEYTFSSIQESFNFYVSSGKVTSEVYHIEVLKTPTIASFEMQLNYPSYTKKRDETIKNTGNVVVPKGTEITWNLSTRNTDSIHFKSNTTAAFKSNEQNTFKYLKTALKSFNYAVSTSNKDLQNYEQLSYSVEVIQDAYPKIDVKTNIDSIQFGPVQFMGQLSDDYGLSRLKFNYYNVQTPEDILQFELPINTSDFERFFYQFPDGLSLEEGVAYEFYFEVFDNDAINGSKSTKSKTFSYYQKTTNELEQEFLKDQHKSIEKVEETIQKNKKVQEEITKAQESLQNKSEMNWNDQKTIQNFIERQKMYDQMMERQTQKLQQNLEQQPNSENEQLEEQKQDIQQRLKEAEELAKQEELLDELEKLAEKLNKEELTEKLKKLAETNRQKERNLERILELTKRFYVEQKSNQISEKLDKLSETQKALSESEENTAKSQEEINQKFNEIQEELKQLEKDNKALQRPMKLADTKKEEEAVTEKTESAKEELEDAENEQQENSEKQTSKSKAQKSQRSAAQKMKQMSQKMQDSMQSAQGETMDEDIALLREILENLLAFSFEQENLMKEFSEIDNAHPEYANKLKKQHTLREYFEHIDDSLYTLSMRQPKIGTDIFKDLSDVHYHLAESLEHFADDQFNVAQSDQQFVMTGTNNIAYLLSNMLNSMQNASPSMGQGNGDSFALPDIIQKQGEAIEQMEEGMKKGEQQGEKPGEEGEEGEQGNNSGQGEGEQQSGELYEIYKQQAALRSMLEEALKGKKVGQGQGEEVLKEMEQLEQDILEKGFSNDVIERMQQLKHELLKLQEAAYEQGIDFERKSNTNYRDYNNNTIEDIPEEELRFNEDELLNRQSLPLKPHYKKRVQEYFKVNDSIQ